jgi:CRISPR system Cascade subunit CasD
VTTLLLRLSGPMQSWGTQSRFSIRDSGLEPSKSGVIGLLCAALGRRRDEPVADLTALRMGVRVDREGSVREEYQTAGGVHRFGDVYGVVKASGDAGETVTSRRFYLADASFLVGLEGSDDLLKEIDLALDQPRWQLSLGRKSFVPGEPVRLPQEPPFGPGLRDAPLLEALRGYPWPPPDGRRSPMDARLRLVVDADAGDPLAADIRADVPISFAQRLFANRSVRTDWVPVRNVVPIESLETQEEMPNVPLETDPESA